MIILWGDNARILGIVSAIRVISIVEIKNNFARIRKFDLQIASTAIAAQTVRLI
jgi:hypothetical protein